MAAVGTLTIEMAANVARLQRDMERATKTVGGAMDRIRRSVDTATRAMGALTAAFAAYKTIQGIIQQADAMTLLNSRLQLVTKSQEEFVRVQGALISISQRSYTNLQATVDLYTALSRATANIGISQNELLRVVETFNKSIIISGGSVQAAEAAITQFNQAMASGVLRGEEFNSISEQAPMIMELLANSLGVTRGALRDMAKEGLLVAELVLPALLEGSKGVDAQFQQLNKTIGQSGVQFKNQFALLIDELNKLTGGTSGASRALDGLTFNLEILTNLLRALNGPAETFNETQAETARLLRQNEEAAKANNEAVASSARAMLEKQKADELAKKAAEELQKTYEKLIETLRDDIRGSTAALQAEQQGLNKAQEDFLKLVASPQWKQYTAAQKMLVTDLFKQRIETEKLIDAEKARAKAAEERLKKMLDDEKEFREELAKEDKKNEEDRIKAQEKLYEEHRREIEKIGDNLTDALMRAFESGKGFGQAFKDTLVNMFRTMVLRPVLAPIAGAFAGAFGGGAAMAAGGGGGALSALSGAGSLAQLAAGASSLGVGIAAGFSNALSLNFAGSLTAAGQLIGTGAMSGITAGLGMAAGTLLPVVGLIAAIPSISRALFGGGRRTTGQGISGTFTTGGANVMGFEDWRRSGGLFRRGRSGTNYSPIAMETQMFLDQALIAIASKTRDFAGVLSLNADAIEGVNQQVRISLMGLSAEQQQQAIANALNAFGDELAKAILGGNSPFIRIGETAGEALTRLATSLSTVNQAFDTMNVALYESSLAAANMASQLIESFGGVESFVQQTTLFYQEFYSEAERTSTMTRQLTTIMGELGFALPKTRDQFRALVEAQDLTTQAGRDMYASLLGIAPLFAQISMGAEQAYQEAQNATNFALTALERSVDAQRRALEVNRQLADENVNNIRSVFETLDSAIRNITGGGFSSATGMAFLEQSLTTARATGYLPGSEELSSAISAVTSGLTPGRFSTSIEFKREQALVLSRLTALREFSEEQLSEAEKQLLAAEQQIEALDAQLELMREQIMIARMTENSIQGLTGAILTIPQAMAQLQTSLSSEITALRTMQTASQSALNTQQQTITVTGKQKDPLTLATDLYNAAGSQRYIGTDIFQGWVDYARRFGNQKAIEHWAEVGNRGTTTATFAAGGLHGGGMRLVGERGPELEVTGPARYMSNATLASMMGNGNNEELRQLREENKVQMRSLVSLQNRMTKIIEQWNGDGLPTERVEA